jgi:hypothetical protein
MTKRPAMRFAFSASTPAVRDKVPAWERRAHMEAAREQKLMARLEKIYNQVQWMADAEAQSAWVKGLAASGAHAKAKEQLLDEAEKILKELRTA